jgi:ankyrin repeat protein
MNSINSINELEKLLYIKNSLKQIKKINLDYDTILFYACFYNRLDVVKWSLKFTNVNNKNIYGSTPLMWACERGNTKIIVFLLKNKADITPKNEWGNTALTRSRSYYSGPKTNNLISRFMLLSMFHKEFKGINENILKETMIYYI